MASTEHPEPAPPEVEALAEDLMGLLNKHIEVSTLDQVRTVAQLLGFMLPCLLTYGYTDEQISTVVNRNMDLGWDRGTEMMERTAHGIN